MRKSFHNIILLFSTQSELFSHSRNKNVNAKTQKNTNRTIAAMSKSIIFYTHRFMESGGPGDQW